MPGLLLVLEVLTSDCNVVFVWSWGKMPIQKWHYHELNPKRFLNLKKTNPKHKYQWHFGHWRFFWNIQTRHHSWSCQLILGSATDHEFLEKGMLTCSWNGMNDSFVLARLPICVFLSKSSTTLWHLIPDLSWYIREFYLSYLPHNKVIDLFLYCHKNF